MPTLIERAVAEYFSAIRARDVERCLAVYAQDAEQHDPYGTPPYVGKDAIRGFLTMIFSGFTELSLMEEGVYTGGNSAAAKWSGRAVARTGKSVMFEGVDVIDCDEAGKIVKVRAFWDLGPVMATLEP